MKCVPQNAKKTRQTVNRLGEWRIGSFAMVMAFKTEDMDESSERCATLNEEQMEKASW